MRDAARSSMLGGAALTRSYVENDLAENGDSNATKYGAALVYLAAHPDVIVTDVLPAGLTYVSATTTASRSGRSWLMRRCSVAPPRAWPTHPSKRS